MQTVPCHPRRLFGVIGLFCLWAGGLGASETTRLPATPGYEQFLKMALALAVVLAVVLVLARLMKSMRGYGGGTEGLEVVGQLPLGARERLLVVRVDDRRLLLGVSAAGITRLHEFSGDAPAKGEGSASFADQLRAQSSGQSS